MLKYLCGFHPCVAGTPRTAVYNNSNSESSLKGAVEKTCSYLINIIDKITKFRISQTCKNISRLSTYLMKTNIPSTIHSTPVQLPLTTPPSHLNPSFPLHMPTRQYAGTADPKRPFAPSKFNKMAKLGRATLSAGKLAVLTFSLA